MSKIILPLVLVVILSTPAMGQIYKWVDKNGGVHFSNTPTSDREKQPQAVLSESDRKQKECIEPDTIVVGGQSIFSDHAWKKYEECIAEGGVKVLPWKKKK